MAALTGYGTLWHVTTPPADLSPRSHRRWIAFILLLALALRIGWVLSRPADDASLAGLPDQSEYLDLGRNLLESRGLFFYDARFRSTVYAYRMPLYPAMIAACGGSIRATLVLQAVLDTSSVLAAACLAAGLLPRQCRRRGTLWASAVVAANPFLLYFCGLILSETLFTTLLLWGWSACWQEARAGTWSLHLMQATCGPIGLGREHSCGFWRTAAGFVDPCSPFGGTAGGHHGDCRVVRRATTAARFGPRFGHAGRCRLRRPCCY